MKVVEVEFCLPLSPIQYNLNSRGWGGGGRVLPIMVCGKAPPERGTAFSGFRYIVYERDFNC